MDFNLLHQKLFANPSPKQNQYEALRLLAIQQGTVKEIAKKFGYKEQTLRNLYSMVVNDQLIFFPATPKGPRQPRISKEIVKLILDLRKHSRSSIYEIKAELETWKKDVSLATIDRILTNAGFQKLERRTNKELGKTQKTIVFGEKATGLNFKKLKPFKIDCPVAGIFIFIPYLIESGIMNIVSKCDLPSSSVINSSQAALSMLLLKLIGAERLSHIQDFEQDPSLGIFAGLTSLPKASYIGSYSCRTGESTLQQLQKKLIRNFSSHQMYKDFYKSSFINLDFHSIPHYGEESEMEKVWCGAKGRRLKGANTLLAQDGSSNVVLYTKADILKKNESKEIKLFVDYWKKIRGSIEETLVFDCRLTTYKVLGELDNQESRVKFITLRKRSKKLIDESLLIEDEEWQKVRLKIPKRKYQNFLAHENEVTLSGCQNSFRQIIIKDHGRQKPTFIITNNKELKLIDILRVYAERWHIENKIAEFVAFFNLNALSSPIMIRIHFDLFWTQVADTFYHRFAQDLPRFEKSKASTIFRKFINFPGRLEYDGNEFTVKIRKRSHTPLLLNIEKLTSPVNVPWLENKKLNIIWTA